MFLLPLSRCEQSTELSEIQKSLKHFFLIGAHDLEERSTYPNNRLGSVRGAFIGELVPHFGGTEKKSLGVTLF